MVAEFLCNYSVEVRPFGYFVKAFAALFCAYIVQYFGVFFILGIVGLALPACFIGVKLGYFFFEFEYIGKFDAFYIVFCEYLWVSSCKFCKGFAPIGIGKVLVGSGIDKFLYMLFVLLLLSHSDFPFFVEAFLGFFGCWSSIGKDKHCCG